METGNKLLKVVKKILDIKEKRKKVIYEKAMHYQKYRKLMGEEQCLSRNLNVAIDELEEFRTE